MSLLDSHRATQSLLPIRLFKAPNSTLVRNVPFFLILLEAPEDEDEEAQPGGLSP